MRLIKNLCVAGMMLSGSHVVYASYLQSFDALTPGAIGGQDGWVANSVDLVQSTTTTKAGQALKISYPTNITTHRAGVFDSAVITPMVRLAFDLNLSAVASDIAGQTNKGINSQVIIDGPSNSNAFQEAVFTYTGKTDSSGSVTTDSFQISGQGSPRRTSTLPVQSGSWYHVVADLDWSAGTADFAMFNADGSSFFDALPLQMAMGNPTINQLSFRTFGPNAASDLYVDNISVTSVPEPSWLGFTLTFALIGLNARARSNRQSV